MALQSLCLRLCERHLNKLLQNQLHVHDVCRKIPQRPFVLSSKLGDKQKKTESRVLGTSDAMIEDGSEISELPVIVRKMMNDQLFPTQNVEIRHMTADDVNFRERLQDCISAYQVFQLLEVPAVHVTPYSASFALQRLCQLRENVDSDLDSFIRTAILHELCHTATKKIESVKSDTIISLVKCCVTSSNFPEIFVERTNDDVERRLAEREFTVDEICTLIELYSSPKGKQSIADSIWIHLASRKEDFNENNIANLFNSLRYMSRKHSFVCGVLSKQVLNFWWKLSGKDVSVIMKNLMLINKRQAELLKVSVEWLKLGFHEIKHDELAELLAAYIRFNFFHPYLLPVLSKYVRARSHGDPKQGKINGMIMELCWKNRTSTSALLNNVAQDFEKHGHLYDPIHLFYLLRPYGHLNFCPKNATLFFEKVENVLTEKFGDFHIAHIVELLATFVYLERVGINFVNKVFNATFTERIRGLQSQETSSTVVKHLWHYYAGLVHDVLFNVPHITRGLLLLLPQSPTFLTGRAFYQHKELGRLLKHAYGTAYFSEGETPRPSPHFINYELAVDEEENLLTKEEQAKQLRTMTKVALLLMMPEHYCQIGHVRHQQPSLLGEYQMKIRHLRKMGYLVVEVSYAQFAQLNEQEEKKRFMKSLIQEARREAQREGVLTFLRTLPTDR